MHRKKQHLACWRPWPLDLLYICLRKSEMNCSSAYAMVGLNQFAYHMSSWVNTERSVQQQQPPPRVDNCRSSRIEVPHHCRVSRRRLVFLFPVHRAISDCTQLQRVCTMVAVFRGNMCAAGYYRLGETDDDCWISSFDRCLS